MKQYSEEYGGTNYNKFGGSDSKAFMAIEKPTQSLKNTVDMPKGGSVVRDPLSATGPKAFPISRAQASGHSATQSVASGSSRQIRTGGFQKLGLALSGTNKQ